MRQGGMKSPDLHPAVFKAADEARTAYLRDVDCNDQMSALYVGIQAAFAAAQSHPADPFADIHDKLTIALSAALAQQKGTVEVSDLVEAIAPLLGSYPWIVGHDGCNCCHGARGGTPGNENVINGILVCDYCHADRSYEKLSQRDTEDQAAVLEIGRQVDPHIVGSKRVHTRVAAVRRVLRLARERLQHG